MCHSKIESGDRCDSVNDGNSRAEEPNWKHGRLRNLSTLVGLPSNLRCSLRRGDSGMSATFRCLQMRNNETRTETGRGELCSAED